MIKDFGAVEKAVPFLGIKTSSSFVREPKGDGAADRAVEKAASVRSAAVRLAV